MFQSAVTTEPAELWHRIESYNMAQDTRFHPVFVELGLIQEKNAASSAKESDQQGSNEHITALDLLQRLLESNVLSSDQIKSARDSLKKTTTSKQATAKDSDETKQTKVPPPQYRYRHVSMHIYYNGKRYSGLAQNVGMEEDNSVERALFEALQKTRLVTSRESAGYSRCGRTDKGVSAVGQVVAMRLKSAIPIDASWDEEGKNHLSTKADEERLPKNAYDKIQVWVPKKKNKKKQNSKHSDMSDLLQQQWAEGSEEEGRRVLKELSEYPYDKMLNSVLPEDIRVLGWCPVSEDFSARFSANTRTYRYFFVKGNLRLEPMQRGLKLLEGTHDFRNFCKLNVVEVSNFERKIHSAKLVKTISNDVYYFEIQGQAFLWHQIRCIVSILFLIGRELESPDVIEELLDVENHPAKPSYPLASEYPLVLHHCGYPNLQIGYSVQNCWTVTCQLEEQWETLILEAAQIRNCLERLNEVDNIRKEELIDFATRRLMERHKKQQRNNKVSSQQGDDWWGFIEEIKNEKVEAGFLTWREALKWLKQWKLIADRNGLRDHIHIPLLERSKGTTYEEKIVSLQQSNTKRYQRFEENTAKKRKSEGVDAEFYQHMLKQGGSGV